MRGKSRRSISAFWINNDSCEGRNIGFQRSQCRCRRCRTECRTANAEPDIPAHTKASKRMTASRIGIAFFKWILRCAAFSCKFLVKLRVSLARALVPRSAVILSHAVKRPEAKSTASITCVLLMYPRTSMPYRLPQVTPLFSQNIIGTQRAIPEREEPTRYALFALRLRTPRQKPVCRDWAK
jgi:hypothetical protein